MKATDKTNLKIYMKASSGDRRALKCECPAETDIKTRDISPALQLWTFSERRVERQTRVTAYIKYELGSTPLPHWLSHVHVYQF
jgi:hypothetical protein